jgi:hypothetical protein
MKLQIKGDSLRRKGIASGICVGIQDAAAIAMEDYR